MIFFSPLEQFIISFYFNSLDISFLITLLFSNITYQLIILSFLSYSFIFFFQKKQYFFLPIRYILFFLFQFVRNLINENFIKYGRYFFNFFFFLFFFLLLANLTGMIPYSFAITSHLVVTLFFSFLIFFSCLFFGFYFYGINFLNLFFPAGAPFFLAPFLITIELVSYMARLFSLAIRLFANIMSGHTLLKILASFSWQLELNSYIVLGFIPFFIMLLVMGLETVIGLLQAYVYTILGLIYLNEAFYLH